MIEKNEILQLAQSLSLSADTIEKDCVLGWMLNGINRHFLLSQKWLFKGGTSLKKCFFETFRFSEDLDFTLTDKKHFDADFLQKTFNEIADDLYGETGIEFSKEMFKFKIIPKPNGESSAQLHIHYNGPLRRKQGVATIKLDLTSDEIVVLKPEKRKVHHSYSDEPKDGMWAICYAFEEVVAEKIRALSQRARPRDVYDLTENDVEGFKEILKAHLETLNKEEIIKETGLSRRTLFRMLSPDGNPTLKNISAIINKLCA